MPGSLLLKNCRPYKAAEDAEPTDLLIRDGVIAAIGPELNHSGEQLDAGGRLLIPGLIDLHIHGAGGADLTDGKPGELGKMSQTLARLGTTTFLGTTVARPASENRHLETAAAQVGSALGGARLAGLYMEGPFINVARKGGIPEESIYDFSGPALDELLALTGGNLRIMAVAPEIPGGLELIERLTAAGITPSFGHSSASYEQTRAGLSAGISHATHLFNAMPGLHHRSPGPILALLESERVPVELISDDVHVSRHMIRFAAHLFGTERCVLITDAMRTAGCPDGRYSYAGRVLETRDGAARYLDGTLIGTSLSLLEITLRFKDYIGCSFSEAVDSASRIPAQVLGIDSRTGSIDVGKDADLVLLESDHSVWATLVQGRLVHRTGAAVS